MVKEKKKVASNDITDLVYIIDKSGSMKGMEKDTIGSFNSVLEKQKEVEGKCLVTTVLFSTEDEIIHNRVDLSIIKDLDTKTYKVGGGTALLDAIGNTINRLEKSNELIKKEFIPSKTIVVIITDGEENSSRKFSKANIKMLIEMKKIEGWEFLFLGANFDAITSAKELSIDMDHATEFICDKKGFEVQKHCLYDAISDYRIHGKVDKGWKTDIEEDVKKRK